METAIIKISKDVFYTIDDVVGSSFVCWMCCFLVVFADVIEGSSCVEFDFGRLNEQICCALNIKEINVKIFQRMGLKDVWWWGYLLNRCNYVNGLV